MQSLNACYKRNEYRENLKREEKEMQEEMCSIYHDIICTQLMLNFELYVYLLATNFQTFFHFFYPYMLVDCCVIKLKINIIQIIGN